MDASNNIFREQFDIITSFNCLHWVKKQDALDGISAAAVQDAQIVLLLSHKRSLYHQVLDKICTSRNWNQCFLNFDNPRSFFNSRIYKDMLSKSRLHVNELIEEEMAYFWLCCK